MTTLPAPLPQYEYVVRPGPPVVAPIFRKSSHLKNWESNERKQNKKDISSLKSFLTDVLQEREREMKMEIVFM